MSQKERPHFSGEEKVRTFRQHLLDGKPVSAVSEAHGNNPRIDFLSMKSLATGHRPRYEKESPLQEPPGASVTRGGGEIGRAHV